MKKDTKAKREMAEKIVNKACNDAKLKGNLTPTLRYFLIKWIASEIDSAYVRGFSAGMKKWTRPRGFKPSNATTSWRHELRHSVPVRLSRRGGNHPSSLRFTETFMARQPRILVVEPHFLEVAQVSAALRYSVKEYGHLIDRQSRKFVEWFADRIEDEHLEKMMR